MEHPYSDHDRSTAIDMVRRNYHTPVRPPQAIAAPCTASIETDIALLMDLLMYGIAAALIALGLAGSVFRATGNSRAKTRHGSFELVAA